MTAKTKSTKREDIRAAIFDAKHQKPKSQLLDVYGTQIEVRQPTLRDILSARDTSIENAPGEVPEEVKLSRDSVVDMIINNCYVPGTNDLVFEDTDRAHLLSMPFGGDLVKISNALNAMTSVNIEVAVKN